MLSRLKKAAKAVELPPADPSQPVKSEAEIREEYTGMCIKAGHIQYQIYQLSKDLDMINLALKDLNAQALEARNREAAKPAEQKVEESK